MADKGRWPVMSLGTDLRSEQLALVRAEEASGSTLNLASTANQTLPVSCQDGRGLICID